MLDNYSPKPIYLSKVQQELIGKYCELLGYSFYQTDNGMWYIEYKKIKYYLDYVGGILFCFHKIKVTWCYMNLQESLMMLKKIIKVSEKEEINDRPFNASLYKMCCGLI